MKLLPSTATLLLAAEILIPVYIVYILGYAVYNRYFHKLRHFPGPFWASITPLWYFKTVRYGKCDDVQISLHDKYGDIVRIAPDLLAVGNASAIETIYMPKNGKVWRKGDFYDGFDPHIPGARTDGFSERNEAKHPERRRIIAPLYTQGSILQYEPCVDRVIDLFYDKMEMFVNSGEIADMSIWLKRYTFDVVGEIYYGRKGGFGMIRDNVDYNKWCFLMEVLPSVGASITYFPWGLRSLYMMSHLLWREGREIMKGFLALVKQSGLAVEERWKLMESGADYPKHDMLANMLDIVRDRGEKVGWTKADVQTELYAIVWAGSDTTAIALTAIFYHLIKHPEKLQVLLKEIDEAFADGRLTYPIRFNDARKLPYLHAVIMEGMRIHPSLGTGLPREVPKDGADLCGTFIPGGCEVIMNAGAVHFDKRAFGDDANQYRPERWLQSDEVSAKMERAMLQFGHGPRVCIGKHITNTEMYKLLPTILRDFEFESVAGEWKVQKSWFHNAKNVMCKVRRRRPEQRRPSLVLEHMR